MNSYPFSGLGSSSNLNYLYLTNNSKNNTILESALFSNKRNRDENLMNYSPNLSAGNFKQFTPIYGAMSPNISKIFMFNTNYNNGSLTTTPLPIKNDNKDNDNSNNNQKISINDTSEAFHYGIIKNENNFTEDFSSLNNINNNEGVINNDSDNIRTASMPNNFSNSNEFYSWVFQKSNILNEDNQNQKNIKNIIKNSKIKNFKHSRPIDE